jgi:hypothetical protein
MEHFSILGYTIVIKPKREKTTAMMFIKRQIHGVIIALLVLGLSGCGYKADPFYPQQHTEKP